MSGFSVKPSLDPGIRWFYMFLNPVLQVFMSFVGLYMSYASQVDLRVIFSVLYMLGVLIDETLMCPTWIKEEFGISLCLALDAWTKFKSIDTLLTTYIIPL